TPPSVGGSRPSGPVLAPQLICERSRPAHASPAHDFSEILTIALRLPVRRPTVSVPRDNPLANECAAAPRARRPQIAANPDRARVGRDTPVLRREPRPARTAQSTGPSRFLLAHRRGRLKAQVHTVDGLGTASTTA